MPEVKQILDETGSVTGREPALADKDLTRMYEAMSLIRALDERCLKLQRQGRIGFYGTAMGEEASVIGSAYALRDDDWIFPALRQGGTLLLRGWPLEKYFANLFGSSADTSLGRSMPCHYADRAQNVVTWSSCMSTQLPHAVGMAYGAKARGDDVVAMAYMGDGATSEGDFHVAMNFAGVWRAPVVFMCHNNQWAISVPFQKQTASRGIAVKAEAYGFPGIRVDGNDVLAVYEATREAVDRARRGEGPTLIEAITYRLEGHSSSDDPTRYRSDEEVEWAWQRDPLARMRRYLAARGIWNDQQEADLRARLDQELTEGIRAAEAAAPPDRRTLVETVYEEVPPHLERQWQAWSPLWDGR